MDDSKPDSPAAEPPNKNAIRRFFSILGPGVITGAADDDPSGIATYSVSGAQLGTAMLWMSLLTWPLMAAVQTAGRRPSGRPDTRARPCSRPAQPYG